MSNAGSLVGYRHYMDQLCTVPSGGPGADDKRIRQILVLLAAHWSCFSIHTQRLSLVNRDEIQNGTALAFSSYGA